MKNIVELTPEAQKKIKKLPNQVITKLKHWVNQVELLGVHRVMQVKGFHDEPLKGKRKGQRSIRLNKAYRAFYRKLNYHQQSWWLIFVSPSKGQNR